MRIVFLSRYQNTISRGAEVFVSELSKRLRKNHQVEILSNSDSDSLTKILNGKYNIVFSINGGWQAVIASLGRIIAGYKLIIVGQSGIGRSNIWNVAVACPDVFVALSNYMASWIKRWAIRSKIIKIPNGVDLNEFKKEGEKIDLKLQQPIILSVGALEWYKYHDRTIEAVSHLKQGSLVIVGEGKDKKRLEKLGIEKLGSRFKIMNVKHQDMHKIYRSSTLFTLPSWDREAFGIAYVEAMASNLPVVAPDDLLRREIIGNAGIFVDVTNPRKYAKAITSCLEKDWKNIPRQQAEKFSWDEISKRYEQMILDLL